MRDRVCLWSARLPVPHCCLRQRASGLQTCPLCVCRLRIFLRAICSGQERVKSRPHEITFAIIKLTEVIRESSAFGVLHGDLSYVPTNSSQRDATKRHVRFVPIAFAGLFCFMVLAFCLLRTDYCCLKRGIQMVSLQSALVVVIALFYLVEVSHSLGMLALMGSICLFSYI